MADKDSALISTMKSEPKALESTTVNPDSSIKTAPEPLIIKCLQHQQAFEELREVWQKLEGLDPACTPFNTWLWLSLWWKHYSLASDTLTILIAKKSDRIVAIAPLYIDKGRTFRLIPIKVLRFIGSGRDTSPDYLNIISECSVRIDAEKSFLDYLKNIHGWQKLVLSDVRKSSSLYVNAKHYIENQKGLSFPVNTKTILCSSLPASWDDYRMGLSRKRRKQINHRKNRLDAAGKNLLSICDSHEKLSEATNALITLHRKRWQRKGETGSFVSNNYVNFHKEVIREFYSIGALWMPTLTLNNEIIGVQYIFDWRGELQFFQSGYSPEHLELSPGHVLFTYVIQKAIEQHKTKIDMLRGNYTYKNAYAKEEIETVDIGFVKPGFYTALEYIAKFLRR